MNLNESELLLKIFNSNFEMQKERPLIIYGLGKNTKYLLEHLEGYNIIGLMDPDKTGEIVYGLPVLTEEEAIEFAEIIVIVARRSAIRIIYERIKELKDYGLIISNLLGIDVEDETSLNREIEENPYWEKNKENLVKTIDKYEFISFDIFDTLISRYVFKPENIFDLVEHELKKENISINFKKVRVKSQEDATKLFINPTYDEIYLCFQKNTKVTDSVIEYIKNIEFEIEKKSVYPRAEMIELLNYSVEKNKNVYLISDMYFNKEQIKKLLKLCGIKHELPLLVSSEYKQSKETGRLYKEYKNLIKNARCLHIGDNYEVDILKAEEYGLETYHIKSGYELAMNSGIYNIFKTSDTLDIAIVLGLIISKLFNSPFSMSESRGIINVKDGYMFGYLFCGTTIFDFLTFIFKVTACNSDSLILFGSRDGYFINKIYNKISKTMKLENVAQNKYFLTSRRVATVAACFSWEDIKNILKKSSMQCTLKELLEIKFGISKVEEDEDENSTISTTANYELVENYVLKYKQEILENAKKERLNYLEYIKKMDFSKYKKIWFYDFVTSGTIVDALNQIVDEDLNLLCFANTPNISKMLKKTIQVESYLGEQNLNIAKNKNIEYYLIWECILTSPDSQIEKFNDNGNPIYIKGDQLENHFEFVGNIQDGIENFVMDFLKIKGDFFESSFDKNFSESIINLMSSKYIDIDDVLKNKFEFENNYENIKKESVWKLII